MYDRECNTQNVCKINQKYSILLWPILIHILTSGSDLVKFDSIYTWYVWCNYNDKNNGFSVRRKCESSNLHFVALLKMTHILGWEIFFIAHLCRIKSFWKVLYMYVNSKRNVLYVPWMKIRKIGIEMVSNQWYAIML